MTSPRNFVPLAQQYAGRWQSILQALGLPAKSLVDRHGPCPICGGKDRFRFDDKHDTGSFICTHCGAGDGPKLAMLFLGRGFRDTAPLIHALAGGTPPRFQRPRAGHSRPSTIRPRINGNYTNHLWDEATPLRGDDPAGHYLRGRLGRTPTDTGLRFHPDCRHPEGGSWPAMLAQFQNSEGAPTGILRTYLSGTGSKANVTNVKLALGALEAGGAVRLSAPGPVLGIAEGVETALAAGLIFGMPVWAALNASRLAAWQPPIDAREVVVFGDNDRNGVGQKAAFNLHARLRGRVKVSIELPRDAGTDWCDELDGRV
jgi:putative DNA primase/helicase